MIRKCLFAATLLVAFPGISAAQNSSGSRTNSGPVLRLHYTAEWNPERVTSAILGECHIQNGFFRVIRKSDGKAHISQSPSVTKDQAICARRNIASQRLEVEGEPGPYDWHPVNR